MGFYLHTHNLKVEVFINCVLNYRMFQMSLSFLINELISCVTPSAEEACVMPAKSKKSK